jgi:type IV secretion system protein VirB5
MSTTVQQLQNSGELDTLHALARAEWDDRIGSARKQARNWRNIAFLAMLCAVLAVGGIVYHDGQPRRIPYYVEIDKLGQATFLGEQGRSAFSPSETQLKFHLERFVQDVRSVSSDQQINTNRVHDAYAMLTQRAGEQLRAYFKAGGDPAARAATETVTTNTIADVQVSEGVYQIDWRERHWDPNGNLTLDTVWRGMFQVLVRQPSDIDDLRKNPIGVYIDQLHWDCVGEGCDGGQHATR